MTIEKLVAGQKGNVLNSTGSQVRDTVNALVDAVNNSTSRPLSVAFIGDSLTNSGTNWAIPKGVGCFLSTGNLTNINAGPVWWIADWQLDGRAVNPAGGGVLETDGNGNLRYNHGSEGFGAWTDVSAGGFFQVPSATVTNSIYVKVVKSQQRNMPLSDSVTFQTLNVVTTAGANIFAEMVKDELGFVAHPTNWGIPSDDIAGVKSRYMQMVNANGGYLDAICLLVGTNNLPSNTASAVSMFNECSALIDEMSAYCKIVFVGGIFPRGDVAQNIDDALVVYSQMLKNKCDKSSGRFVYWDAYSSLLDPSSLTGALKTGAYHTDNLHLMPFGALLAKKAFLDVFGLSFSTNRNIVPSRSNVFYNEVDGSGFINQNPCYLGSGGTQQGSPAVTGRVPTNCVVSRTGGTQTITFSDAASDNQNALRIAVAGATTGGDYHELRQAATLPTVDGGWAGRYIQLVLDMEIEEATNVNKLEFALISDPLSNGVYWNQTSRVISGFNANNKHRVTFKSEPLLVRNPAISSYSVRLRVGTQSGGSCTLVIRSAGIQEYRN